MDGPLPMLAELEKLSGRLFESVIACALSGTFAEDLLNAVKTAESAPIMVPVEESEKVVGEMNRYENALNFLREKYDAEEKKDHCSSQ